MPKERLFIYAGLADRLVRPDQPRALWRHWGEPEIHWFSGGHVASQMKDAVGDFVESALRRSELAAPLAPIRHWGNRACVLPGLFAARGVRWETLRGSG